MRWKQVLCGVLGLGMSLPAAAGPAEEFPGGPVADDAEVLPVGEEGQQEPVDVMRTLEEILTRMKNAEASLAEAGKDPAIAEQGRAVEGLSKIFDNGTAEQAAAVRDLETLIKAASDSESSSTSSAKETNSAGRTKPPPADGRNGTLGDPAKSGYRTTGSHDLTAGVVRTGDAAAGWGNLPPRLREELLQSEDDFRAARGSYREKLFEYSKIMSRE